VLSYYLFNKQLKYVINAYANIKKWGKGKKILLQFSKYNKPAIEEAYSTHYIDSGKASGRKQSAR